jgi:MerR family copper efflux transcriptional regulator
MRICELAKRAGVTPRTARYFERLGLIPQGEREGNGQHHYPELTVTRLKKIDQLKEIGLSLEEVRDAINLHFSDPSGKRPKRKVHAILRQHGAKPMASFDRWESSRRPAKPHPSLRALDRRSRSIAFPRE